jgi:hypothetical protein
MLVWGLILSLTGVLVLGLAIRRGRRTALFSATFWLTFPEFARYRLRRLWPAPLAAAGIILLIWGLILLLRWLLAYYAARLGHPVG